MHFAHRYITSLFLTAALVVPASIMAAPVPQEASVQVRVYDKNHKDYHNWDDNENHAWGQYLTENHKKSHDFKKAPKKEQSEYWDWRHSHADEKRLQSQPIGLGNIGQPRLLPVRNITDGTSERLPPAAFELSA